MIKINGWYFSEVPQFNRCNENRTGETMLPVVFFAYADSNMPSTYYRVLLMADKLCARGYDVRIVPAHLSDSEKRMILDTLTERSIIYIQKTGNSFHVPAEFLPYRDRHILVFDIDDYIESTICDAMIASAHAVICGSHYLKWYADRFAGVTTYLLPCCVDEHNWIPAGNKEKDKLRVVWSHCFAQVYADDLLSIAAVLRNLHGKYGFELLLCGFRPDDPHNKRQDIADALPFARLVDYQPAERFTESVLPLVQESDIAVVPFMDTPARAGKAGLTLRNYMLMELPVVASAVGEHQYIIDHGINGFLAKNPAQWGIFLEKLMMNRDLRIAMGSAAREKIEKTYGIDTTADSLVHILQELSERDTLCAPVQSKPGRACAVVLGRLVNSGKPPATLQVGMESMLGYIRDMLISTGVIDQVIFAMPDDTIHHRFADTKNGREIDIRFGDPDNPAQRFLEVFPQDAATVYKFVLEKPFADTLTLRYAQSMLHAGADHLRVSDSHWGVAFEGFSKDFVVRSKRNGQKGRVRYYEAPFLGKKQYEPYSIHLGDQIQIEKFITFINEASDITVDNWMRFLWVTRQQEKSAFYAEVHNRYREKQQSGTVCVVIDKKTSPAELEKFFSSGRASRYVLCIDADVSGIPAWAASCIRVSTDGRVPLDELDISLHTAHSFLVKQKVGEIISLNNDCAVFAVRLSQMIGVPVYCHISEPVDPGDRVLKHHLSMANHIDMTHYEHTNHTQSARI